MYQNIKTLLYHGTVSNIEKVDVSLGFGRKDFGKGFYMAVTKKQAVGMMNKKYREAVRRSRNKKETDFIRRLYEIQLNEDVLKSLRIKKFESADMEWLDFVLHCRKQGGMPHNYDMVIGPTADDDTALCLKAYQDGLYGKTDSKEAKKILLGNLEPENLGVQYFIGKQEIADKLIKSLIRIEWRESFEGKQD